MRILIINGSPHRMHGLTATLALPFIEGIKEAGAEVEIINIADYKIGYCKGCIACWLKTPGECVQKDDMEQILPKLKDVDIEVLMTPVYCDGMTGQMKSFIDRTVPLVYPFVKLDEHGRCRHPKREGVGSRKVVLFSSCAWYSLENFEPMISHIKAYCRNLHGEYLGAILRPHSSALPFLPSEISENMKKAAFQLGKDLVVNQSLTEQLLGQLSAPLIPIENYIERFNQYMESQLSK